MNYRKQVEEKILYIFLTFKQELISDKTSLNSFDIIRKHSLTWQDFKERQHQDVFKAIANQMGKLPHIELATLVEYRPREYKTFEQQSNQFLALITNAKTTAFAPFSELEPLLFKLKEFILIDHLQGIAQNILSTNMQNLNVIEYGENMVKGYQQLYERITSGIIQSEDSTNDMIVALDKKMANAAAGIVGGIKIPIFKIHDLFKGWNPPDLIVIGARPSMGKSTTALAFADMAAADGKHTMYVSIEMSKIQLTNIIVSNRTGIPVERIKHGQLSEEEAQIVKQWYLTINNSPLNIVSQQYKNLEKLKQKARELHKINKLDFIIIDYLQLMSTDVKSGNRDQMIGVITGELKSLAMELNIPIMLLSQLKRGNGSRPKLEDLRESGNIEQDADIVAFIHRDAFFDPNYDKLDYNVQWLTEFLVRKHRGGKLDTIYYFQDVENARICDWEG